MTTSHIFRMLFLAVFLAAAGCRSPGPFYGEGYEPRAAGRDTAKGIQHTVYLIGDAGDAQAAEPVLGLLAKKLQAAGESSTTLFLGDNIYPSGLPAPGTEGRADAEQDLDAQLQALEGYAGRAIFLAGNHDWNNGLEGGWAAVRRQDAYIDAHRGSTRASFLPDNGCPGPVEVRLRGDLTLIVLGTSWWLYPHEKPTPSNSSCAAAEDEAFIQAVDSLLTRNAGRRVLLAGHHPVYSSGLHGSPLGNRYFDAVEPFFEQFFGERQDLSSPRYMELRTALLDIFRDHQDLVYAAGHDHSLQYHPVGEQHYLVSGAGAWPTDVAREETAAFAYAYRGFLELTYYDSGRVRLRAWIPAEDGRAGRVIFQTDVVERR